MMTQQKRKAKILTEADFEIKTSIVPKVGQGLFTKTALRPGDTIGYYTGEIIDDKQADLEPYCDSLYLLWVCKDHWIYGEGKLANYTRFINHSDKPNAELFVSTRWKTARFEVIKPIPAGGEIYFDYGDYYWEQMGFRPVSL